MAISVLQKLVNLFHKWKILLRTIHILGKLNLQIKIQKISIISVFCFIAILANSKFFWTTTQLKQLSCLLDWFNLFLALPPHPSLKTILSTKILLSQNCRMQLMTPALNKQNPPMPIALLDGVTASWSRIQKDSKRKNKSGTDQSKTRV